MIIYRKPAREGGREGAKGEEEGGRDRQTDLLPAYRQRMGTWVGNDLICGMREVSRLRYRWKDSRRFALRVLSEAALYLDCGIRKF